MAHTTVSIFKFVGTISLGLLTGLSYSLTTTTVPTLLALPSASSAQSALNKLQRLSTTRARALSLLSASSLVLAYALSPARARHPYLLWTSLVVGLSAGADFALSGSGAGRRATTMRALGGQESRAVERSGDDGGFVPVAGKGAAAAADGGEGDVSVHADADADVHAEPNGERVKAAMEKWRLVQACRAAVAATGFAMAVVGIWGDGY